MARIVVLGEALIDIFAEKGQSLRAAKTLYPRPGGAPANVAVALARLGVEVGFIGKVGADEFGALLVSVLAEAGVDTTYFVTDPHAATMLAFVAAPSPTEQNFIIYEGASTLLKPEELPQAYITSAKIFIYGSVTLASASGAAAWQAAQWAYQAGRWVIFDVNLRPAVWPNLTLARQRIERSLAWASVVKLNENELEFLTGTKEPSQGSQQLIERGVSLCCVSLGAEGAYFNNGRARGHVSALTVEVQDSTGSGDAFVAGLAYQLSQLDNALSSLDETTLRSIIHFANACGALAATQMGAMSASPTLERVKKLLQSRAAASRS